MVHKNKNVNNIFCFRLSQDCIWKNKVHICPIFSSQHKTDVVTLDRSIKVYGGVFNGTWLFGMLPGIPHWWFQVKFLFMKPIFFLLARATWRKVWAVRVQTHTGGRQYDKSKHVRVEETKQIHIQASLRNQCVTNNKPCRDRQGALEGKTAGEDWSYDKTARTE